MKITFFSGDNNDDTDLICHYCQRNMVLDTNDHKATKAVVYCESCTMCIAVVDVDSHEMCIKENKASNEKEVETYDLMYIYRMINFFNVSNDLFVEKCNKKNKEKIENAELLNIKYMRDNLNNKIFMKKLFDKYGVNVNDYTNVGALKYIPKYDLVWEYFYLFEVKNKEDIMYISLIES